MHDDAGNMQQMKEGNKVKGLCVCNKDSEKIANFNKLVKYVLLYQIHHPKETSMKSLQYS